MFSLKSLIAGLAVACALPLAGAVLPPTRTFTVRAYIWPFPVGSGLTGYYLQANNGNFYIQKNPPAPKSTLFVSRLGKAYTVSDGSIVICLTSPLLPYSSPRHKVLCFLYPSIRCIH